MPASPKPDPSTAADATPESISFVGLADRFLETHKDSPNRAFAFVLGAGASRSSNIKTAGEMVADWIEKLYREATGNTDSNGKAWATAKTLRIRNYDPANPAASYSELYQRMYITDPDRGYAYLEAQMRNVEPSYDYSVLARIMEGTQHKVVVTTNFDNLVADSLSIYGRTYPLVCGHESLAGFISETARRPLVVKVHRDILLAPKSSPKDVADLPDAFCEALRKLFARYTPIFIGYAGNDVSLMKLLNSLPEKSVPGGVYWCYWQSGISPSSEIQHFVKKQHGCVVPIPGFDEIMLLLGNRLEYPVPDSFLMSRAKERADRIVEQFQTLTKKLTPSPALPETTRSFEAGSKAGPESLGRELALNSSTESPSIAPQPISTGALAEAALSTLRRTDGSLRWWQWDAKARSEKDPAKAEQVYKEAVSALPDSLPLLVNYANFLRHARKDNDAAEAMYRRAINADPDHAVILDNYANFLRHARKDNDAAEAMYRRAINAAPDHAGILGNYANFLTDIRKDHDVAEAMYRRLIDAEPDDANSLGNYARLLLATSRVEEGRRVLDRAISCLDSSVHIAISAECWMYAYCCGTESERPAALARLKHLITKNAVRTDDWDFSGVVAQAKSMNHPEADWLPRLASVLAGTAEPATLESWPAWQGAADTN